MLVFSLVLASNDQVNLQEINNFLFAAPGHNITLPCFNKDVEFRETYYWYKQSLAKSQFVIRLCADIRAPQLCLENSTAADDSH
ncbi:unnamed protein product [Knipowitschia caucasica]